MKTLRRYRPALILAAVLFLASSGARTQSIPDLITRLGIDELARDYLRPAADAVGYNFNSGLYHTARVDSGFHLWIGARLIWTMVPEADRSFVAHIPEILTVQGYPAEIQTATVLGGKGAVLRSSRRDSAGTTYPDVQLPDGIDASTVAIAVPHVEITLFAGTQVMLRGIPTMTFDNEIGKVSFIGGGIKHSPTAYLDFPFDLAVMVSAQRFKLGEILTVSNVNANVHASLPSDIISPFAGFGYEGYSIDVSYTYKPTDPNLPPDLQKEQTIALHFKRPNFRFTVGVNVTLLPILDLTADYSFGVQDNFSIGAGLSL